MKIIIETIPHEQHRYTTVGDSFYDPDGTLRIKVSELSDWRREFLIGLHELVEVMLCKHDGISTDIVAAFDRKFDANRAPDDDYEPGDEPSSPYVRQHCVAAGMERILAAELGVSWKEYENELVELPEVPQITRAASIDQRPAESKVLSVLGEVSQGTPVVLPPPPIPITSQANGVHLAAYNREDSSEKQKWFQMSKRGWAGALLCVVGLSLIAKPGASMREHADTIPYGTAEGIARRMFIENSMSYIEDQDRQSGIFAIGMGCGLIFWGRSAWRKRMLKVIEQAKAAELRDLQLAQARREQVAAEHNNR